MTPSRPMTRFRPTRLRSCLRIALALALAIASALAPGAMAGSLKWQSSNPAAPRPGPAPPPGLPQRTEPPPEREAMPVDAAAAADLADPADPGIARSGDYLARMDSDGDGRVSLIEYQQWLSYAFEGMDANRDGVLTAEEQPGGRGSALSLEAHRARVADTFARQDSNHDGHLDARELAAPPQAPRR